MRSPVGFGVAKSRIACQAYLSGRSGAAGGGGGGIGLGEGVGVEISVNSSHLERSEAESKDPVA